MEACRNAARVLDTASQNALLAGVAALQETSRPITHPPPHSGRGCGAGRQRRAHRAIWSPPA